MSDPRALDPLLQLQDAAVDDLQNSSDDDLWNEAIADGVDVAGLSFALRCDVTERLSSLTHANSESDDRHSTASSDELASLTNLPSGEHFNGRAFGWDFSQPELTTDVIHEAAETLLLRLDSACTTSHLGCWHTALDSHRGYGRSWLLEQLLATYVDESSEQSDLFPGSYTQLFHKLLHDALEDPQISQFASISMGTLSSTLCTLALAKASGFDFHTREGTSRRNRLLRQFHGTKTWSAFHRLINRQPEMVTDSVDAPRAVTGLAAMQAALDDYRPDGIIAVAGGGEIVATFLSEQLRIDRSHYFVASPRDGNYLLDRDLFEGGALRRVVVIDDISRTGRTLSHICHKTLSGLESVEVRALPLVSAATATCSLQDFLLVLPVVSHSPNVSVPWDNKGCYRTTRTNHVFGAKRREPLRVDKRFYERTYTELKGVDRRAN